MSRSVRQDYNKLRTIPHRVYLRADDTAPAYIGALVPKTDEMFFNALSIEDVRYARKTEEFNVSPTNEDWALYHQAKKGLLALQRYDKTEGLEHIEIPMPKPETRYKYTETAEAWLERCHALYAERTAA